MTSLRQRMLEDMQVRRLSPFTQRTYVETVARFARYFDRSPERLGPEQVRAYQVYLATERRLATSSLLVAVAALRFLYRVTLRKRWSFDDVIPAPKKPQSLPVVLSPQEVVVFLDAVKAAKHRAILTTCYAAGLRISEASPVDAAPSATWIAARSTRSPAIRFTSTNAARPSRRDRAPSCGWPTADATTRPAAARAFTSAAHADGSEGQPPAPVEGAPDRSRRAPPGSPHRDRPPRPPAHRSTRTTRHPGAPPGPRPEDPRGSRREPSSDTGSVQLRDPNYVYVHRVSANFWPATPTPLCGEDTLFSQGFCGNCSAPGRGSFR